VNTRRAAVILSLLALAACETEGPGPVGPSGPRYLPPPAPPAPPPAATVLGHGAYRTKSGGRGDCAGLSVLLMHDIPSYRRRMIALYGSAEGARLAIATVKARSAKLGPAEDNPMSASVQCDSIGDFAFRDVAPGSYFIIARVHFTSLQGVAQDVVIMRHLDLSIGETRDVSLAP
jgi:hypothetical protein